MASRVCATAPDQKVVGGARDLQAGEYVMSHDPRAPCTIVAHTWRPKIYLDPKVVQNSGLNLKRAQTAVSLCTCRVQARNPFQARVDTLQLLGGVG